MEKTKCCKKYLCLLLGLAFLSAMSILCTGLLKANYGSTDFSVVSFLTQYVGLLAASVAVMLLTARFGRELLEQYCWAFPLLLIILSNFMRGNELTIFGTSVEVLPLVSALALVGLAVYFDRFAVNSPVHMTVYGVLNLALVVEFRSQGVLMLMLLVLNLILFVNALHEKQLKGKYSWLVFLCVLAAATFFAARRVVYGIFDWRTYCDDPQYIITYIRRALGNLSAFGGSNPMTVTGGNARTYRLIWIMEGVGWVPGALALAALVAFALAVLRRHFLASAEDRPFTGAVVSVILVRTVIFILANFGIVLNTVFASAPLLSEGTSGYFATFLLIGLLLSSGKQEEA